MKLTTNEKSELTRLKKVVSVNERSFVLAGNALDEIQTRKLYREEALTFESFCFKNWGWKKAHAYRMIEAAGVVKTSPIGDKIKTESQARELAKVPPEKHEEVLKKASAMGAPTAKTIAKAAVESKPRPDIILDCEGFQVTPKAMPFWNRREEIHGLLTKVSQVKSALKHAQEIKDLMFVEVRFSSAIAFLENVYDGIKTAMPHTVCPRCQGKLVEKCVVCGGRGVISKFLYETAVDKETKKMREKK